MIDRIRAADVDFDPDRTGRSPWRRRLAHPTQTFAARTAPEVLPLIDAAELAAQAGAWVVLLIAYEAAPAFDPALVAHRPAADSPLALAAVFPHAATRPPPKAAPTAAYAVSPWSAAVSRTAYDRALARIRTYLADGHAYQVNYTFPLTCRFKGDPQGWYDDLRATQGRGLFARFELGHTQILSLSPELFFLRAGRRLLVRPMKGTAARGRWPEEDLARARFLRHDPKNRAENVMIVDLLRNDLSRVAASGSVRVERLFETERYETLWQLTSTITATARPGLRLRELLGALFPSGSVTGAPKIRTMEIIRELEPHPRRLYTGAIGLLRPGGDGLFSVPIRTILIDGKTERAHLHIGSGITHDSVATAEYDECLLKAAFTRRRTEPFELLETFLLKTGRYRLARRHLARIRRSAIYFGFALDPAALRAALARCAAAHPRGAWRVRLRVARNGATQVETSPLPTTGPTRRRVAPAPDPVNSADPMLFHKTTRRALYERALRACPGADDVILWNEKGEATESTIANLMVTRGERLFTPPLACGLLPGTFRAELLARHRIEEAPILMAELKRCAKFFLVNSVRGRLEAEWVSG